MEYAVPSLRARSAFREICGPHEKEKVDVVFPLEYRYVRRDDTLLSMSSGHEDHAAISIHRMASEDYRPILIHRADLLEVWGGPTGGRFIPWGRRS